MTGRLSDRVGQMTGRSSDRKSFVDFFLFGFNLREIDIFSVNLLVSTYFIFLLEKYNECIC